jgi:hypothetical protein
LKLLKGTFRGGNRMVQLGSVQMRPEL